MAIKLALGTPLVRVDMCFPICHLPWGRLLSHYITSPKITASELKAVFPLRIYS
jgi:hypothetical protein